MKITRENIVQYYQEYFEVFNSHGQSMDSVHDMDRFYAPDFAFKPYVATIKGCNSREEWYRVVTGHPAGHEHLEMEDIIIDLERLVAAILIKAEISDPATGEVKVTKRYFGRYPMKLDENDDLKITALEFFWEVLPPGATEIDDVFFPNRKK